MKKFLYKFKLISMWILVMFIIILAAFAWIFSAASPHSYGDYKYKNYYNHREK